MLRHAIDIVAFGSLVFGVCAGLYALTCDTTVEIQTCWLVIWRASVTLMLSCILRVMTPPNEVIESPHSDLHFRDVDDL